MQPADSLLPSSASIFSAAVICTFSAVRALCGVSVAGSSSVAVCVGFGSMLHVLCWQRPTEVCPLIHCRSHPSAVLKTAWEGCTEKNCVSYVIYRRKEARGSRNSPPEGYSCRSVLWVPTAEDAICSPPKVLLCLISLGFIAVVHLFVLQAWWCVYNKLFQKMTDELRTIKGMKFKPILLCWQTTLHFLASGKATAWQGMVKPNEDIGRCALWKKLPGSPPLILQTSVCSLQTKQLICTRDADI